MHPHHEIVKMNKTNTHVASHDHHMKLVRMLTELLSRFQMKSTMLLATVIGSFFAHSFPSDSCDMLSPVRESLVPALFKDICIPLGTRIIFAHFVVHVTTNKLFSLEKYLEGEGSFLKTAQTGLKIWLSSKSIILPEDPGAVPAPTWRLITTCNPSFLELFTLPSYDLHGHFIPTMHTHTLGKTLIKQSK